MCGRVALGGPYAPRQWRGGGRRATAARAFPKGFAGVLPANREFADAAVIAAVVTALDASLRTRCEIDQLFSSALILLSNSSNEVAPLTISPLMKKVGVELTFSTSAGEFLVGGDLVEQRLILQAVLDRLLAEPGLLADPRQGLGGVLRHPVVLLPEQHVDDGEIFAGIVLGDAARQHRARRGLDVEREFAEHVTDLAAVDVFRLDLREHGFVEVRAMPAGHRGVFGDRHRGVGGTERHVRQRHRLGDVGRALRHRARSIRRSGENPASRLSPVSDRAAVKARRVMIKGLLPDWRVHARRTK